MHPIYKFGFENFWFIFLAAVIWNVIVFSILLRNRSKKGLVFPKATDHDIVFSESRASGSSHKSIITRLGGASRCLTILVNESTFAVTTFFPFTALAGIYDLEHIIPLERIKNIETRKGTTYIEFTKDDGSSAKISLRLKDRENFEKAIKLSLPPRS